MRNNTFRCLAVIAAALMVVAPAFARPATGTDDGAPAPTPWETVAASGPVQAMDAAAIPGVWRDVARGDRLMPDTQVQTGRKARATLTRNASLMILDPDSRVELPGDTYRSGMETSVVQTEGSVLYKVDSRANPHFEVVTPFLVAGVKGTSFLVTVNEKYASVTVKEGLVEVTNTGTGDSLELGPGDSAVRGRDDVEMDMVRSQDPDRRRSHAVRKETDRLDRMQRWLRSQESDGIKDVAQVGPVDNDGTDSNDATGDLRADSESVLDDPMKDLLDSWTNDADAVHDGSDDVRDSLLKEVSTELVEEMIREDINEGVIKGDPGLPNVTLPPVQPAP